MLRVDQQTLEALGKEAYERGFKDGRALAAKESTHVLFGYNDIVQGSPLCAGLDAAYQAIESWFKACGVLK